MDLEGDQALQRTLGFFEVEQVDRHLTVDLVNEVISLRDDGVLMPLGDIDLHRLMLAGEPALRFGVDDDALTILHDDAASTLFIDHRVVGMGGMNITLIAADGPLAVLRQFLAAVLDAGVVALLADFRLQLEVFHLPAAPDEKLIVSELLRSGRGADDLAVFNLPQLGIAIPAGEVFAIEDRFEACVFAE